MRPEEGPGFHHRCRFLRAAFLLHVEYGSSQLNTEPRELRDKKPGCLGGKKSHKQFIQSPRGGEGCSECNRFTFLILSVS